MKMNFVKLLMLFCLIFLFVNCYSQKKKFLIKALQSDVDSLNRLILIKNKEIISIKYEHDLYMKKSTNRIDSLHQQIAYSDILARNIQKIMTDSINLYKEQLNNRDKEVIELKNEIIKLNDTLVEYLDKSSLEFLDISFLNLSDEQIVNILNISSSDPSYIVDSMCYPDYKSTIHIVKKLPYRIGKRIYAVIFVKYECPELGLNTGSGLSIIASIVYTNNSWRLNNKIISNVPENRYAKPPDFEAFYASGKQTIAIELTGGGSYDFGSRYDRVIYHIDKFGGIYLVYEGGNYFYPNTYLLKEGKKEIIWKINFIKSDKDIYDLQVREESSGKVVKKAILKYNIKKRVYE